MEHRVRQPQRHIVDHRSDGSSTRTASLPGDTHSTSAASLPPPAVAVDHGQAAEGQTSTFVPVEPGVRLCVADQGEGVPLLFVHGWPSNHHIFDQQLAPLTQRGYRTIGVDLRGFGMSDKPWDGNDYDTWARDLGAVIQALDLHGATLVGYSMGGAIALHYVATTQDPRVTRLALIAAALPCVTARPDHPTGAPREYFDGLRQALVVDRRGFLQQFVRLLFTTPVSEALLQRIVDLGMQASERACIRGLEELRDRDLRGELAAVHIPTRIFHGVHDQVVPFALGQEQQRLIREATLVQMEVGGHGLLFEEQQRLNDELAAFAS